MGGSSRCTSNGQTPSLVQFWYGHGTLLVLAFNKGANTGIGNLVQYQYGHVPLQALASQHGARTGTGIFELWFSTGIGTVHYRYWHSVVPIPVMANMYLESVPVWAHSITRTGIKLCPYQYWHFCTFVQYQYWHGTLPVLALNGASTGIGIFARLWSGNRHGKRTLFTYVIEKSTTNWTSFQGNINQQISFVRYHRQRGESHLLAKSKTCFFPMETHQSYALKVPFKTYWACCISRQKIWTFFGNWPHQFCWPSWNHWMSHKFPRLF